MPSSGVSEDSYSGLINKMNKSLKKFRKGLNKLKHHFLDIQNPCQKSDVVAYICNTSTPLTRWGMDTGIPRILQSGYLSDSVINNKRPKPK